MAQKQKQSDEGEKGRRVGSVGSGGKVREVLAHGTVLETGGGPSHHST